MSTQLKDDVQNEQSEANRWYSPRHLMSLTLIILAIAVLVFAFGINDGSSQPELLLVFTLAAYFPFTYLAYWAVRTEMRRKRLEDELFLLGYSRDEGTRLYEQVHNQASYFLFITLSILTTIIGSSLLFWSPSSLPIDPSTIQAIRYGFLGSYLFSAFLVYRRFSTNDLHPTVYLYCGFTMIAGIVFNYVAVEALTSVATSEGEATGVAAGLMAIVAFALGYFPYLAVRWFNRLAFTSLGVDQRRTDVLPLSLIDGISEWHETRLRDTGIDDIQNLASAEIRELLVNTAFNVQEIIEWIDQATLYLYLEPSEIESFRRAKIRMTSDFCILWEKCETDTQKLEDTVLNLQSTAERLRVLYSSIIEGPNVHRVINYWKRAKSRVDENIERVAIQLGNLADMTARFDATMQELDAETQRELIREYGGLLSKLWSNPSHQDVLNLGKLHLSIRDYDKAIEYFDTVITKVDQPQIMDDLHSIAYHSRIFANAYNDNMDAALRDCDTLIEKTAHDLKRHLHTYIIKSYICDYFKQYEQSLQTLEKAINIDAKYAEGYNRLALHYTDYKPHTPENLIQARDYAVKAVEISPDTPDYLDTLAYTQIMYAEEVETAADAKEKLYHSAYKNLQLALNSPEVIPNYGYQAISDRLRQIVWYWQSVATPQAIEYEEDVLLTALTIPTQNAESLSEIKSRLKELRTHALQLAGNVNGVTPHEAAVLPINIAVPLLDVPSAIVETPGEPPTLTNATTPQ